MLSKKSAVTYWRSLDGESQFFAIIMMMAALTIAVLSIAVERTPAAVDCQASGDPHSQACQALGK